MANFVDLKFITDDSQLDRSIKKLGSVESQVKKLVAAEQKGQITTQQFNKRIAKLATEFQRASGGSIAARNAIFKFSREVYQSTKAVEESTNAIRRNSVAAASMASAQRRAGKDTNRFGVAMQQTGYQVGDFLVQIQSGTNAFVAFGQQATQLVGILPMFNSFMGLSGTALVGLSAGLGIVIPLVTALGAAFMRTRKEAEDGETGVKNLTSALRASARAAKDSLIPVKDLTEEYGRFAEAVRESSRLAAQAQVTKALASLGDATENTRESLNGFRKEFDIYLRRVQNATTVANSLGEQTISNASAFEEANRSVQEAKDAMDESAAAMGLTSIEANRLYKALGTLEEAQGPDSIAKAAQQTLDTIRRIFPETEKIPPEIAEMVVQLDEVLRASAASAQVMEEIANIDMASGISAAAIAAGELADNLRIARGYRLDELTGGNVDFFDPRNESGTSGVITRDRPNPQTRVTKPRKASGGGSTPSDPVAQLMKQLELERELVGVSEDRARVIRALGLDFVQKNPEIAEGLQEQIAKTRELIEAEKERQSVLQTVETSLENGLMAMVEGTKSVKDAFKDMARAIIKELYDVYVVQRLVGGFGQNGGSGSGILGLLGGLFGKASGGTVMSNQPYLVGEKGPELIVPRNRGHVMNADLTADALGGGGGVTVVQNFNFQANGDESVKKLIAQAAPSIANMAKQSVMDSRRRGGAMKNAFG